MRLPWAESIYGSRENFALVPCEHRTRIVLYVQIHYKHFRGRARTFVTAGQSLVRDEIRKEVSQNPEQRQTRDAITREYPRAAAFMVLAVG